MRKCPKPTILTSSPRSKQRKMMSKTDSTTDDDWRLESPWAATALTRSFFVTVTKNDLVNAVAAHGLSKRQSSSVVESVFDIIFRCFERGEDVKIVGFGHFRIRKKASRRGRNPQTGESIEITARRVLTFKPSKGLKQRINSATP